MDENEAMEGYVEGLRWIRERVPPDDIYEFAYQTIMAAEFFLGKLNQATILVEDMKKDEMLAHWVENVVSLSRMKQEGFKGIINVGWKEK